MTARVDPVSGIEQGSNFPEPKPFNVKDLKSKFLMRPSLTSRYMVYIDPPGIATNTNNDVGKVANWMKERKLNIETENLMLSCSEAVLPGSSLATIDIDDAFTGSSFKNAYRRVYDDRIDLTYYVDVTHYSIRFFENWMAYIVDEQYITRPERGGSISNRQYHYRVNYPNNYKTDIRVVKFEKDFQKFYEVTHPRYGEESKALVYRFIDAFPISISSMPLSYDSTNLLKVSVSFAYTRYVLSSNIAAGGMINVPGGIDPKTEAVNAAGSFEEQQRINAELNRRLGRPGF